jgi:hypothetical protein
MENSLVLVKGRKASMGWETESVKIPFDELTKEPAPSKIVAELDLETKVLAYLKKLQKESEAAVLKGVVLKNGTILKVVAKAMQEHKKANAIALLGQSLVV